MTALSVFRRVLLGYLVIMFLSIGILSYAIIRLAELSQTAHTALDTDNRMIEYQETLTDLFLSEARYAGKFVIGHTGALYDQYGQFKNDFERYAAKMQTLAPTEEIRDRVSRVQDFHYRYGHLLEREASYIKIKQPYATSRYQNERDKTLESTLKELEFLKGQLQKHLRGKLEIIETSAVGTRQLAILAILILLVIGITLSMQISKSITTPLLQLTRQLSIKSEAAPGYDFRHIPEIHQLAEALAHTREQLQRTADRNERFARSVTEKIETPLIGLRERVGYLKENLSKNINDEQRDALAVLLLEAERLVNRFQGMRALSLGGSRVMEIEAMDQSPIEPKPFSSRWSALAKRSWNTAVNRLPRLIKPVVESIKKTNLRAWIKTFVSLKIPEQRKAKKP